MLQRRGYVPELSFGAFEGDRLTSFTINSIDVYNDRKTAYDTGTGTIRSHRGKGLARRIFEHSLPYLQQAGIRQYLLEVLQHNTTAVALYKQTGFEVNREFNYFVQNAGAIRPANDSNTYQFRPVGPDRQEEMRSMWDFHPSWQNSFASIERERESFVFLGVFDAEHLAGYGVMEPSSGDITQLAMGRPWRRKGIGTALLKELLKYNRHHSVKVLNTETSNEGFTRFLERNDIPLRGKQFEMIKEIG
jgi:ribosomal protein S18 acetylase RimI-like enzyme